MSKIEEFMIFSAKRVAGAAAWIVKGALALVGKLLCFAGKLTAKAGKCTLKAFGSKVKSFNVLHCETLLLVEIVVAALALAGGIVAFILRKKH